MDRRSKRLVGFSIAGVFVSAVAAVWVAGSPDGGADLESIRQGVAYGIVLAAGPLGMLLAHDRLTPAAGIGGGMMLAGAVTMWGGNLAAPFMFLCGLPLAWIGWNDVDGSEAQKVVLVLVLSAVLLVAATYLVLASGWMMQSLGALLAVLVVLSSFVVRQPTTNDSIGQP